jgi:hypothetical protein
MRKRFSYANVAATLALVFSMSGGALAANHYLISSTKQISPKVLKKLKGATGKAGAPGAMGATGATGKEGPGGKEGAPGKDATIPTLSWTPVTLENGWITYSGYYGALSYAKDAQGFVHLSGAINGAGKTSEVFATLPAGFRPTRGTGGAWVRAASTNGGSDPHLVDILISKSGAMEVNNGPEANDKFVSLEGVTFYAG